MGQQQLLLVILVTILVGIATLVAFNVFGTAAEEANRDAVRQDILAAAAQAQAIWTRPAMMDGAGQDFATTTTAELLPRLNIPGTVAADGSTVTNENGVYTVAITNATTIAVTGDPSSDTENIIGTVSRVNGVWEITWSAPAAP